LWKWEKKRFLWTAEGLLTHPGDPTPKVAMGKGRVKKKRGEKKKEKSAVNANIPPVKMTGKARMKLKILSMVIKKPVQ